MKRQPYHKASGRCHISAKESALTDRRVGGTGDQIWFYFQVREAQHFEALLVSSAKMGRTLLGFSPRN